MPAHSTNSARLAGRSFERILLVKPSSLGDVIHALPVLHGLRARYPNARLEWLIGSTFAPLIENHPDVDDLVLFDRKRFARVGRSPKISREFADFVLSLRARSYDLVIDLQGLFRTGFLAFATGAAVRIGFAEAREAAWLFYTHRLNRPDDDTHAVDRNYAVADVLGFADFPIRFELAFAHSVRSEATDLLEESGHAGDKPLIVVLPGARWETKRWPADRFAAAIEEIQCDAGTRCLLLGAPDEAELCRRIAGACRNEPMNLAGRTSLPMLAALIERADVVLAHDSAPMHLAVALERPLVCLIGPTNPHRTGPYRRPESVVRLELECAPCYLRKLPQCGFDHRCMRDLPVATVVEAVRRARETRHRARGGQRSSLPA